MILDIHQKFTIVRGDIKERIKTRDYRKEVLTHYRTASQNLVDENVPSRTAATLGRILSL